MAGSAVPTALGAVYGSVTWCSKMRRLSSAPSSPFRRRLVFPLLHLPIACCTCGADLLDKSLGLQLLQDSLGRPLAYGRVVLEDFPLARRSRQAVEETFAYGVPTSVHKQKCDESAHAPVAVVERVNTHEVEGEHQARQQRVEGRTGDLAAVFFANPLDCERRGGGACCARL